ncbi:hypothetical protein OE09_0889 [Flavobacteriaceae bacterium MAR_2010_72]|nr:hypothetical protein OE09_0889 [Flavobacteriaceae bacterium MAR_2010_72]
MIKFFRNIRQTMIKENRATKYALYAIGEIILVVIGILIALSINNWNENEKLKQKEINIAEEIYTELNENIAFVKNQLKLWESRDTNINKVLNLIASDTITITQREFDSIMIYVIGFNNFKLKHSKFSKIIESENFEFTRSNEIITEMLSLNADYNTLMAYYEFNETNYSGVIEPYLLKNYSFRNLANVLFGQKSIHKLDFRVLLDDLEFDNVIHTAQGNNQPFVMYINNALKKMEQFRYTLESVYPTIKKE